MPEKDTLQEKTRLEDAESDLSKKLARFVYPLSHSPWTAWTLSSLFFATSPIGFGNRLIPPFPMRFGFGLVFSGAGYIISTGDAENGSATACSWSGSYFVLNAIRYQFSDIAGKSIVRGRRLWQRPPLILALNSATFLTMIIYGSEYFWFQNFKHPPNSNGKS